MVFWTVSAIASDSKTKNLTMEEGEMIRTGDDILLGECRMCGMSWKCEPIPEDSLGHYNGSTHYSRLIAVVDGGAFRVACYRCPDCGYTFRL